MTVDIRYKRNAILRRLAGLQLIPVIVLFYVLGAGSGYLTPKSPTTLSMAALGILAIYCLIMTILIKALREPSIFSVNDKGVLSWRPAFKTYYIAVPEKSSITVNEREVIVRPQLKKISTTVEKDNSTVFKIPTGVERVQPNRFII